ncbi:MAG: DUF3079 domain-containing protein [Chloroflexi bacterium]|nr:DUF3079 domain-containing protein [Chloroflexota bacterium]
MGTRFPGARQMVRPRRCERICPRDWGALFRYCRPPNVPSLSCGAGSENTAHYSLLGGMTWAVSATPSGG